MNDLESKIVEAMKEGGTVAFLGEGADKALRTVLSHCDIRPFSIPKIENVSQFTLFQSSNELYCVLDESMKHMASRFSMWVYTENGSVRAVCRGHYGDCTSRPLGQEVYYLHNRSRIKTYKASMSDLYAYAI